MTTVLLVDWLGRGGIAQTSLAWLSELASAGISTSVVSRPGRELPMGGRAVAPRSRRNRLFEHIGVVRAAVRSIEEFEPDVVIIQNHVLPPVEGLVDKAAHRCGAHVIRVVHDHALHTAAAGTQLTLRRLLNGASSVAAHSSFVANQVEGRLGRPVVRIPLPIPPPFQEVTAGAPPEFLGRKDIALQFGVLHRSYKGTDLTHAIAAQGAAPWTLAVVGAGAKPVPRGIHIDRYLQSSELAAIVAASGVSLFPYRRATQSGGIVVAQALGSVPVASSVGGLVEQIVEGRTGRLVPPDAPPDRWVQVLQELAEPDVRASLAMAARDKVRADHAEFRRQVVALIHGAVS